jgi:CBS domain-containing protein
MLVKDVMSKNPTFLTGETTLKDASVAMSKIGCGFIPIQDGDELIGAVTDRDITIRATAEGKDPNKTFLKDIMTKGIKWCFEEDELSAAAAYMSEKHVHRLAVMDKNKRLTGIISLCDIATKSHDASLCGDLVEALSEGAATH